MSSSSSLVKGLVILLSAVSLLFAQPPPGPPPHPVSLSELRRRLEAARPVDLSASRALEYSRQYLALAEQAHNGGRLPESDRYAAAANALFHVADHQQHLHNGPGPRQPRPAELQDHLRRVYFRTQQANFFVRAARDRSAAPLAPWAREFYQLALRAYDRHDYFAADENAKCAEEIVNALENIAQAANLPPLPPA